jgi:hypothetical protein
LDELLSWLSEQHNGLQTYVVFQDKALQLASQHPDDRALFHLLAAVAERFIDSYEEAPLPVEVAERAFKRFSELLQTASNTMNHSDKEKIRLMNEISRTTLG